MSPPVSHLSRSSAGAAPARAGDDPETHAASPRSLTRAIAPGNPTRRAAVITEGAEFVQGSDPRSGASSPGLPDLPLPEDLPDGGLKGLRNISMSGGGSLYAPIPHGGSGPSDNSIFSNGPRSEAYPEGGSDKGIDSGKGFNRPSSPLSGRSSNEQITDVPVPKSDSAPKLEKRHPTSSPSQSPLFKQEKTYGTAGDGKDSLRKLFKLPDDEKFVEEYLCALYKKILLQGRMYVFTNYVCFYSNVFGYTKVKTIALKDVTIVNRAYTAQVVFNAIEIVHKGKCEFFTSFIFPDRTYKTIVQAWRSCSRYSKIFADQNTLSGAHDRQRRLDGGPLDGGKKTRSSSSKRHSSPEVAAKVAAMLGEPVDDDGDGYGSGPMSIGSVGSVVQYKCDDEGGDGDGDHLDDNFFGEDESSSSVIREDETLGGVSGVTSISSKRRSSQPFKAATTGGHGRRASAPNLGVKSSSLRLGGDGNIALTEAPETVSETSRGPLSADESDDDLSEDEALSTVSFADELKLATSVLPTRPKDMQTLQPDLTLSCSVEKFFNLAWSDAAGETFTPKCSLERQHRELRVTNWSTHVGYGHARDLTFVAPTNASIGPKETHCHQTQSYKAFSCDNESGALAVDTSQVQKDIPYGDYFRVETRWECVPIGDDSCSVWVGLRIPFQKTTMLRKVIEKGALEECSKGVAAMIEEVKSVLEGDGGDSTMAQGCTLDRQQSITSPMKRSLTHRPTHRRQRSFADAIADTVADTVDVANLVIPDGSRDVIWRMLFGAPKDASPKGTESIKEEPGIITGGTSPKSAGGKFQSPGKRGLGRSYAMDPTAHLETAESNQSDENFGHTKRWIRVHNAVHTFLVSKRVRVLFIAVLIAVFANLAYNLVGDGETFLFDFAQIRNIFNSGSSSEADITRWKRRAASLELELKALERRAAFVAGEAAHAWAALAEAVDAAAAEKKEGIFGKKPIYD